MEESSGEMSSIKQAAIENDKTTGEQLAYAPLALEAFRIENYIPSTLELSRTEEYNRQYIQIPS